jgi:3-deoxy-7-phosphoheptulonate synthase
VMQMTSGKRVVRVGRIAGQFAKPRSAATEPHGETTLPVFRGHMVNGPEPDAMCRRPDPLRLLACYDAAGCAMAFLRGQTDAWGSPLWTSHEALVLDYELPLLRHDLDGRLILTSTHWPWIGDRTRQPDGAHVRLLAMVSNPVACKVGPGMAVPELLELCERLDPEREPGRLTLIARLGADLVAEKLAALVDAVRAARHPVIWLCDPMHGNTVIAPDGRKTRFVPAMVREVREFQAVVANEGGVPGGLHLEATPDLVSECAWDDSALAGASEGPAALCDPRLNQMQAVAVAAAWYM